MTTIKKILAQAKQSIFQILIIDIENKNYLIATTLDRWLQVYLLSTSQIKLIEKSQTKQVICYLYYDKYYKYDLYAGSIQGKIYIYEQFYKFWLQNERIINLYNQKSIENAICHISLVSKFQLVASNIKEIIIIKNSKLQKILKLQQSILFVKGNLEPNQNFPYLYLALQDLYPPMIISNTQIGLQNLQQLINSKNKKRKQIYEIQEKNLNNLTCIQIIENYRIICTGDFIGKVTLYETIKYQNSEFISSTLFIFHTNEDKITKNPLFPILDLKIDKELKVLCVINPEKIIFINWQERKKDKKGMIQKQDPLNIVQWTNKNQLILTRFQDPFLKNYRKINNAQIRIYNRQSNQ